MRKILESIEDFLIAFSHVGQSMVGKWAVGDSGFVAGLRAGRKARAGTSARVRQSMAEFAKGEPPLAKQSQARKRVQALLAAAPGALAETAAT